MLSPRFMYHEMKAAGAKEQSIVYWRRCWLGMTNVGCGSFLEMEIYGNLQICSILKGGNLPCK